MLFVILATCSPEELEDTEISSEEGDEGSRAITNLALPPSEVAAGRQAGNLELDSYSWKDAMSLPTSSVRDFCNLNIVPNAY
jgi:hypothetical protein